MLFPPHVRTASIGTRALMISALLCTCLVELQWRLHDVSLVEQGVGFKLTLRKTGETESRAPGRRLQPDEL